jgi:hypothetical protein
MNPIFCKLIPHQASSKTARLFKASGLLAFVVFVKWKPHALHKNRRGSPTKPFFIYSQPPHGLPETSPIEPSLIKKEG